MPKPFKPYWLVLCLLPFCPLCAEEADEALPQIIATSQIEEAATPEEAAAEVIAAHVVETPARVFAPFTGKVRAKKLRLRVNPELDGYIIKELNKDDLLSVIGEKGDFWAVEPLADSKAYIFRSFVLDNTVEGNHVNLRLEPSLEAPIIGHMNSGERVEGTISPLNNKWLEITPPKSIQFYVSKEYVENVGGPEVKVEFEGRQAKVQELLDTTALLVKAELSKPFVEMDIERLAKNYHVIINEYSDFTQFAEQAKSELAALNETYLMRKIDYLERKASGTDDLVAAEEGSEEIKLSDAATDKMKLWEPIEESLYLTWARLNEDRNMHEYYDEQKLNSVMLTGIVESYNAAVKNKPGCYILRDERELPIGYLYSTNVNLDNYIGKKITMTASPRPNNNFAFPAYFVYEVE